MSVSIKSAREIELIRESCKIIAKVHQDLGKELKAGMSTLDVDRIAVLQLYACLSMKKSYMAFREKIVSYRMVIL